MSETSETKRRSRLRWVTLGEAIAIAALILSGLGLWREWHKPDDKPLVVEKEPRAIPLALRGRVLDDGRSVEIAPIEDSHALESLVIAVAGTKIGLGSDGRLTARDVEDALGKVDKDAKGTQRVRVRVTAQYVEAGADKSATGSYVVRYRWEGGGLFGGRSLRLVGLSR